MQRLEVSGVVRLIYESLGFKRLAAYFLASNDEAMHSGISCISRMNLTCSKVLNHGDITIQSTLSLTCEARE
jgi:hypothetical protein